MFCLKCGNKIEDGESFCTKCGEKVEVIQESLDTQPKKKNKKALVGISIGAAAVIVAAVVVISIFAGIHNSSMNRPFDQLKKGINTKNAEVYLDGIYPKEIRERMEKEIKSRNIDITNSDDIYSSRAKEVDGLTDYCLKKDYILNFIINNDEKQIKIGSFKITECDPNPDGSEDIKESIKYYYDIDVSDIAQVRVELVRIIDGEEYSIDEYHSLYKYKGKWYVREF